MATQIDPQNDSRLSHSVSPLQTAGILRPAHQRVRTCPGVSPPTCANFPPTAGAVPANERYFALYSTRTSTALTKTR